MLYENGVVLGVGSSSAHFDRSSFYFPRGAVMQCRISVITKTNKQKQRYSAFAFGYAIYMVTFSIIKNIY